MKNFKKSSVLFVLLNLVIGTAAFAECEYGANGQQYCGDVCAFNADGTWTCADGGGSNGDPVECHYGADGQNYCGQDCSFNADGTWSCY